MNNLKISIVTPSFNQGKYIEQTILSVLDQGYPNLEYIIIDGGSTDETVEIIKKYESKLKYWVSEKDLGQADAINKGLQFCTGDIFNWINSDDYLADGVLFDIAEYFSDPATGIVAGAIQNFDESGSTDLVVNKNLSINHILSEDWSYVYHQPGAWMRLNLVKTTGLLRADYHYCFDHEFLLRYLLLNDRVFYTKKVLANFRIHGASKTVTQSGRFVQELNRMYLEFYISQKGKPYYAVAKRKSKLYEWGLSYNAIRKKYRGRAVSFVRVFAAMLKDPKYRFNRTGLGTLKHILLGDK